MYPLLSKVPDKIAALALAGGAALAGRVGGLRHG